MIRLVLIAGLGLNTAACATAAPGSSASSHLYRCEGGKSFTASYDRGGQSVQVTAGGASHALPLARSASGARYATDGMELWGKGSSATLTGIGGGPYEGCVTR